MFLHNHVKIISNRLFSRITHNFLFARGENLCAVMCDGRTFLLNSA